MIHIAKKVTLVLPKLRSGVGGVACPDASVARGSMRGPNYAILQNVYPDPTDADFRFFDHDAWWREFRQLVFSCFPVRKHLVIWLREVDGVKITERKPLKKVTRHWVCRGTILIRHHRVSGQLEFMRVTEIDGKY